MRDNMEKKETKKVEKKEPKKIEKKHYYIECDLISPIKAKYSVWAEDPNEAMTLVKEGKAALLGISRPIVKPSAIINMAVFIAGTINKILSVKFR